MTHGTKVRRPQGWEHPSLDDVDLDIILDALGDPVRLEVIRQLADAGGVLEGSFEVHVTQSTLSHHLKVLADGGLVRVTQVGRFRRCELRIAEAERRFPGLLPAVLTNAGAPLPGRPALVQQLSRLTASEGLEGVVRRSCDRPRPAAAVCAELAEGRERPTTDGVDMRKGDPV